MLGNESGQGKMREEIYRGTKKHLGLHRYVHYLVYGNDFAVFVCTNKCVYVYINISQTAHLLKVILTETQQDPSFRAKYEKHGT